MSVHTYAVHLQHYVYMIQTYVLPAPSLYQSMGSADDRAFLPSHAAACTDDDVTIRHRLPCTDAADVLRDQCLVEELDRLTALQARHQGEEADAI